VDKRAEQGVPEATSLINKTRENEIANNKRMDDFNLLALNGILALLEA